MNQKVRDQVNTPVVTRRGCWLPEDWPWVSSIQASPESLILVLFNTCWWDSCGLAGGNGLWVDLEVRLFGFHIHLLSPQPKGVKINRRLLIYFFLSPTDLSEWGPSELTISPIKCIWLKLSNWKGSELKKMQRELWLSSYPVSQLEDWIVNKCVR